LAADIEAAGNLFLHDLAAKREYLAYSISGQNRAPLRFAPCRPSLVTIRMAANVEIRDSATLATSNLTT
jgi:hypothetical protein